MRRTIGVVVVALLCVGSLSSCSLLSGDNPFRDNSDKEAKAEMQHIADAVKHHDAAALEALFSPIARERSTDLDSGLDYFLSFFPSGQATWSFEALSEQSHDLTNEIFTTYKVSTNGLNYDVYFSEYPNQFGLDSKWFGIYSLGVHPFTKNPETASGTLKPFFAWQSSGVPGIYIPQN